MKKLLFLLTFLIGIGVAFFAVRYFIPEKSQSHRNGQPSSAASCSLSCCLSDDIKLNARQRETMQTLESDYCQCRDSLSIQIDRKRLALADLLLQSEPDLSAIDSLLMEIGRLQTELEKKTITHILEVKKHLTPKQRAQFIKPIVHEIRKRCQHGELPVPKPQ